VANVLVIAPHADDEVLGCGGMVAKRQSDTVHVAVATVGGPRRPHLGYEPTVQQRYDELVAAMGILGVKRFHVLWDGMDKRLDTLPQLEMVTRLDAILEGTDYDEVYFPSPSHDHDHRTVSEAALAALRPYGHRHMPSLIAQYEYAYLGWGQQPVQGGRMYVDISGVIAVKERALEAYRSQMREPPHPVSIQGMRTLASLRGLESGHTFAEMFWLLKWDRP